MTAPEHATTASAEATATRKPRAIESASASTACQTNSSAFCYVVTGACLGVLTLVTLAIALLAMSALTSITTDVVISNLYGDAAPGDKPEWSWDETWSWDLDGDPYARG